MYIGDYKMKSALVKPFVLVIYIVNAVLCAENSYDIIIIGAGPAGIEAAIHLYKFGYKNITILETESYIGGFINTVERDSPNGVEYIEKGDQWMIGGSPADFEICTGHNDDTFIPSISFKTNKREFDVPFIFSNGTELSEGARNEAHGFVDSIYRKTYESDHLSLSQYVNENSANRTGSENLPNGQNEINRFYENFILLHSPIGDWDSLSYTSFAELIGIGHSLNYLANGLSSLFKLSIEEQEIDENLSDFNVQFNKTVKQINYSKNRANVLITTTDNVKYTANKVIVTTPIGALKSSYRTVFTPALSRDKVSAIDSLNVSYHEKALLEFDVEWWQPNDFSYYQLWSDNVYKELSGDRKWLTTLIGFSVVDNNPKMLVAYFKGHNARLLKDVSDNSLKSELLRVLRSSLPKFNIPDPVEFYRTNWAGNPRFYGGFSYRTNFEIRNDVLTIPENNKIYFAGEHTVGQNGGTLVGDKQSGSTVAQQIKESDS